MKKFKLFGLKALSGAVMLGTIVIAHGDSIQSTSLYGVWPSNNGSSANLDVVTSDSILNPSNVANLVPLWTTVGFANFSPTGANAVMSTPVIADGNVYIAEAGGTVRSYTEAGLNGQPQLNWVSPQLTDDHGNPELFDESPVLTKDYVFIAGKQMHKLSRATGQEVVPPKLYDPVLGPMINSDMNLLTGFVLPSQLMLAGDKVIYGVGFSDEVHGGANDPNFPNEHGVITAFNQKDLSIAWKVDLTNVNGVQYGPGSGTFSGAGVDDARHLIFMGTSNNYMPPVSPLSDSLVAIDYRTGKIKWSYQFDANDLWGGGGSNIVYDGDHDLDVQGHPQIFSLQLIPGFSLSSIDLVGVRGKDGTYRIFTRDQIPGHVVPIAQIQLDPASSLNGSIQADPVIKDGTMYVASQSWIDPANPTAHTSQDILYAEIGQNGLSQAHGTIRSIDLRQVVLNGIKQLALGNNKPVCVGSAPLIPSLCTGQLPSSAVNWEIAVTPLLPFSSSGLTYDNGVLFVPNGLLGQELMLNASDGSIINTLQTNLFTDPNGNPFSIPTLGGVVVDNGKIFVPIGQNFGGHFAPLGGVATFGLPQH